MHRKPVLIKIPAHAPKPVTAEDVLMHSVAKLKERNHIFGELLTINELVEPLEEKEIGYSPYQFEGGDADIIAEVRYQMAVESGQVVEMDETDNDEEDDQADSVGRTELIKMCKQLERSCISHTTHERSLD